MQRRKFIGYAPLPLLTGLIAACGGGDSGDAAPAVDGDDIIIDPGVDPANLASAPDGIAYDVRYLLESTPQEIRCSVALGDTALGHVPVTFYDVTGNVIGKAVTNEQGLAITDIPVRHLVVAEAVTEHGTMFGMRFYAGDEYRPVLFVDLLQTVVFDVAQGVRRFGNVSIYLIQDYLGLPHELNLFNVGHDYPAIDQRLMAQDWRSSGYSLSDYVTAMSKDIIDKKDDDVYVNQKFSAYAAPSLRSLSDPIVDKDLFELFGEKVVDTISDAIPIPFASVLLKYGFGKLTAKIYPDKPDPFLAIQAQLNRIEQMISEFTKIYSENEWLKIRVKLAERFLDFSSVMSKLEDIRIHYEANPDNENFAQSKFYKDYLHALMALTDNTGKLPSQTAEFKLTDALNYFMGEGPYKTGSNETIPLDGLFNLLRLKKFYGAPSEQSYRGYLGYLIYHESIGYMLLALSMSVRAMEENRSEAYCAQELQRFLSEYEKVKKRLKALDVEPMPERVNIDYRNKLAWIGSCGLIKNVNDFWPPNRKACAEASISASIGAGSPVPVFDCRREEYGQGLDDWKGPDPQREMARADAHVSEPTKAFGKWRSAKEKEFRVSFFDDLRGKKLDVYAAEQGFSCVLKATQTKLTPFHSYLQPSDTYYHLSLPERFYANGLAKIPTEYRRAGHAGGDGAHYYLDCTCFDLSKNSSASRNVRNNYGMKGTVAYFNPSRYIFFPTCEVSDALLAKHVPWIKLKR